MRAFCIAFSSLMLVASAASAETCEEQVTAFAETHRLQASPPKVENMGATEPAPPATLESRGLDAEPLEKSGGVAEPVDESVKRAAGLPLDKDVGRPTREEESRQEAAAETTAAPREEGERRLLAENFLLGAMSAANEGREKECLALLQQAQDVI